MDFWLRLSEKVFFLLQSITLLLSIFILFGLTDLIRATGLIILWLYPCYKLIFVPTQDGNN